MSTFEDISAYIADLRATQPTNKQEAFLFSHLPFVISVAKKYMGQGLPLLDLIQEGNIGMMKAAEKYDESLGVTFLTYAAHWVKQTITRALAEQARLIRAPVYLVEALYRYRKKRVQLEGELGREPTEKELATALEISLDTLASLRLLQQTERPESLYWSSDNEEDERYGLEDNGLTPEEAIDRQIVREDLSQCLRVLTEKERRFVLLYFIEQLTYKDIHKQTGHDPEMIRRTIERAKMKMRARAHRMRA
jgi:RNA polymerase primary sigma factor